MVGNPNFDALLEEVCTELGFCGSVVVDGKMLHVSMFIPDEGSLGADDFVRCVFQAEGLDPNSEAARRHAGKLREAFIRHMGEEVPDVRSLK